MAFKLSLPRKSDAQPAVAPLWHPNFRNFERLPDTKVVRTTFFVNTAAIAVTLGLLLLLGYREYHLYSVGEQIAEAQREIDGNSKQNREALRLTKIFADEEKKLAEAEAFGSAAISPAEFVTLMGETLPREVAIESVDAKLAETGGGVTFQVRGLVAGTPDQAAGTASNYVTMLQGHPRLSSIFNSITLANLNRDARSSFLTFDIIFKLKVEAKGKK